MRTTASFQILTALGWLGLAGLQHFYLGRPGKGLVWFFTFGLFLIGTIYDHMTASTQVERANRLVAPGYAPPPAPAGYPYPPSAPRASSDEAENLVRDHGAITAEQIKAIAGGTLAASLRELDKLRYDRLIDDAEFAALKSKLIRDYS